MGVAPLPNFPSSLGHPQTIRELLGPPLTTPTEPVMSAIDEGDPLLSRSEFRGKLMMEAYWAITASLAR